MDATRMERQMAFLTEADKLKTIIRRTPLTDSSRLENSAEHSWHLALAAVTLAEYAPAGTDVGRVLELVAVHDLVEIDAGDTFAYDLDTAVHESKADRERAAAERVFGLLPADQAARMRARWEEFEAQETAEARFANALDRFQALLQNAGAGGGSWSTYHVTRTQVMARMAPVQSAAPALWPHVLAIVDAFCASGAIAGL